MTEVFISYKKEDVDRVRLIAEALAQAGYEVWWDHRIPPGRTYREVIGAALQTAKCVIVVWSQKSIESQWVLDEADAGQQRRVLLPILIVAYVISFLDRTNIAFAKHAMSVDLGISSAAFLFRMGPPQLRYFY